MANISEKNREARLRWLGHMERNASEDVVGPNENIGYRNEWTPKEEDQN